MATTIDNDTELSAVNSILGSIGQSPVNSLNLQNPEIEFVYNVLTEVNKDVQNEGWLFNTEEDQEMTMDGENLAEGPGTSGSNTQIVGVAVEKKETGRGWIKLADTILNVTLRKGAKTEKKIHPTVIRSTSNPVKKLDNSTDLLTGYIQTLYDLEAVNSIGDNDVWDITAATVYTLDVTTLYSFERVPTVFQRYITYRSAVRAATQLIANPQLVSLLQLQEVTARANCLEYEGKQGDHSFFGLPNSKRLPSQLLQRTQQS